MADKIVVGDMVEQIVHAHRGTVIDVGIDKVTSEVIYLVDCDCEDEGESKEIWFSASKLNIVGV